MELSLIATRHRSNGTTNVIRTDIIDPQRVDLRRQEKNSLSSQIEHRRLASRDCKGIIDWADGLVELDKAMPIQISVKFWPIQ